ncbi:MAG: hypothetical protein LBQ98_10680, partial [Nitrososphaerota archaeon]|nr:hypothetical protein [Nitrososphaerota archaeon]
MSYFVAIIVYTKNTKDQKIHTTNKQTPKPPPTKPTIRSHIDKFTKSIQNKQLTKPQPNHPQTRRPIT